MYQGSPKDVKHHLARIGRKVPKGENSIEYLIDVIQENSIEYLVEALAKFARAGLKPPPLPGEEMSVLSTQASSLTPGAGCSRHIQATKGSDHRGNVGKRQKNSQTDDSYDHSLRSRYNNSRSWSASDHGVLQGLRLTPSRTNQKVPISMR